MSTPPPGTLCWHGLSLRLPGNVLAILLALASSARAHDFWIEPSTFTPEPGSELSVRLFVGDGPQDAEPYARNPAHALRFLLVGAGGESAVAGEGGAEPAGVVTVGREGLHLLVYESHGSFIEIEPEKFAAYLQEEGLDGVLARRKESEAEQQPGRELYVRCAKALVRVGEEAGEGFDRVLGLPCELVPQVDPTRLRPGESGAELPVRLLARGRPVAGARVDALSLDDPARRAQGRTDEQGRVVLALPAGGRWLLTSVHMEPASADGTPVGGTDWKGNAVQYDWRSAWASLTFATE